MTTPTIEEQIAAVRAAADHLKGKAELALRAALETLEAERWRSIDDCPDDGRAILVFGGRFTKPTQSEADGEWWRIEKMRGSKSIPTLWREMPLPPSPDATSTGGEG